MTDVQEGLLVLLKEFDGICRKHHITYYLEGGSLLGAVRHHGFLPWDDDVDLCITQANWKKLLSVIDEELPEHRELYCYERFPGYLRDTIKYTNLDTTVIFPNHILDGYACGQHIDIFVLDPVADNKSALDEHYKYSCIYSELMMPVYVMCPDIINYLEEYHYYQHLMKTQGKENTLNVLRKILFSVEENDDSGKYCIRWGNRHLFVDKAIFGEPVNLPFEGELFPAPSQYYRLLRVEFGDTWMMLPDKIHQADHNTFDNFNIPCDVFKKDYMPFIDYQQAWTQYEQRKEANISLLIAKNKMQRHSAMQYALFQQLKLDKILKAVPPEVTDLIDMGLYREVSDYFQPLYEAMLSKMMKSDSAFVEADMNVVYNAAKVKLLIGHYWEAEEMISLYSKGKHSSEFASLSEEIQKIRELCLAKEEHRIADAKSIIEGNDSEFSDVYNIVLFQMEQKYITSKDRTELISDLTECIKRYPEHDEMTKLLADALLSNGQVEDAEIQYRNCSNTKNGILRMQIPQKYLPE